MTASAREGELAIVLHTHMPYVEGFGTWPFGEEWLWEAMATSYIPLLDVLAAAPALTLSLTPVLCDQLEAPGISQRFTAFLSGVRRETHARDAAGLRETGEPGLADEVERAADDYERALERFEALGGDLLGALAPHAAWTSSATHAVLPLLATDAGVRLQVETGIAAHRRRARPWRGGFWLPECAYAPWLDTVLEAAGVHAVCLDLTDVLGRGAAEQLWPLRTPAGPIAMPIDRETIELVWSDGGYPAAAAYRDYHHHTIHHHRPWGNDGRPYDHAAALTQAREHAADFVTRTLARLATAAPSLPGPPLAVCALDTELLGHWWYEGVAWLEAVVQESERQGLALVHLDDALAAREPAPARELPVTSWGSPRDLTTWSGPASAEFAWAARAAELRAVAAEDLGDRAVRELLALQSSDWAFMHQRELASSYPQERARAHARAFDEACSVGSGEPHLRSLAPDARGATLRLS